MGETVHEPSREPARAIGKPALTAAPAATRERDVRPQSPTLSPTRLVARLSASWLVLAVVAASAPFPASALDPQAAPEAATGWQSRATATAKHQMVAAASPYAAQAGLEILRQGGSAADAAVAVQLVLNLVEPQSSGLGGGAFVLYWDAERRRLEALDGRETAPAAADPAQFLRAGRPRPFEEAVFGGLSVGVPGTLRVLE